MTRTNLRSGPPKLNSSSLQELALAYVSRYATTRYKLRSYLARKLRERGWSEEQEPELEEIIERFAKLRYVDDAAYALARSRDLSARGYGKRRLAQKLRLEGVDAFDGAAAGAHADAVSLDAALLFARRRRMGPFASAPADPRQREKWIAAMVRAGHEYPLARAITALAPGAPIDRDALGDLVSPTEN